MAVNFYNRYIPPSRATAHGHSEFEPASKRRRLFTQHPVPDPEESTAQRADGHKTKKKPKPPKKVHSEEALAEPGHSGSAALDDNRHGKLRQKLEKTSLSHRSKTKNLAGEAETSSHVTSGKLESSPSAQQEKHGLEPLPQPSPAEQPAPSTLEALPDWIRNPVKISPHSTCPLSDLLPEQMCTYLAKNGYTQATAIQKGLLPLLLSGKGHLENDYCIASSTGTGKTLAFIAPMIEALKDRPVTRLRGLVVVPTREIVTQTLALAKICAHKTGLQIESTKGSKDIMEERKLLIRKTARYDKSQWNKYYGCPFDPIEYESSDDDASDTEFEALRDYNGFVPSYESKVDILICTPGRLIEHMRSTKGFTLSDVEWLIVDEMDRLLDSSFMDWTDVVMPALEDDPEALSTEDAVKVGVSYIMRTRRIRKVLASATVTFDPDKLAAMHLHRPVLVTLDGGDTSDNKSRHQLPTTLRESSTVVRDTEKPLALFKILQNILQDPEPVTIQRVKAREPLAQSSSGSSSDESTSSSGSSTSATSESHGPNPAPSSTSSSGSDDDSTSSGESSSNVERSSATGASSAEESTSSSGSSSDSTLSSGSSQHSSSSSSGSTSSGSGRMSLSPKGFRTSMSVASTRKSGVLIFTARNENAMRLARLLTLLDPSLRACAFTGSSRQSDRRKALHAFRRGEVRILIASNLASRSLNIDGLDHVINYDVPTSVEMYIHRVGRTARAGRAGTATTLLTREETRWFRKEVEGSELIQRQNPIQRDKAPLITTKDMEHYEIALQQLGDETRAQ